MSKEEETPGMREYPDDFKTRLMRALKELPEDEKETIEEKNAKTIEEAKEILLRGKLAGDKEAASRLLVRAFRVPEEEPEKAVKIEKEGEEHLSSDATRVAIEENGPHILIG
jgi:hypothetical protein